MTPRHITFGCLLFPVGLLLSYLVLPYVHTPTTVAILNRFFGVPTSVGDAYFRVIVQTFIIGIILTLVLLFGIAYLTRTSKQP
jgi:hypothetical protein